MLWSFARFFSFLQKVHARRICPSSSAHDWRNASSSNVKTISWLHITDLHIGQNGGWLWPTLKQKFFEDLKALASSLGTIDFVFFTGDVVQTGAVKEFSQASDELAELWIHFADLGSNPFILCVPGNHDLVRPNPTKPHACVSRSWNSDPEVRDEFWNHRKMWMRKEVSKSFGNYESWLSKLPIKRPPSTSGLLPGDFSAKLSINGLNIGIVGLNTTFLQVSNFDYQGKLDTDLRQLNAVTADNPREWGKDLDISVLLTHQPPAWLRKEGQIATKEIGESLHIHSHFCGHLHESAVRDLSEFGGRMQRLRQGASLLGLDHFGSEPRVCFGYTAGQWSFDEKGSNEFLWPRVLIKGLDDVHKIAPDTRMSLDGQGRICSPFEWKRRTPQLVSPSSTNVSVESEIRIVSIDKPIPESAVREKLRQIPRYAPVSKTQHEVIRLDERETSLRLLNEGKPLWLIADWRAGAEGFLGTVIKSLFPETQLLPDCFRLHCGTVSDSDAILLQAETQLGLSFQEFVAAIAELPHALLVLEDIPASLTDGIGWGTFQSRITSISDFGQNLRLVLVARKRPSNVASSQAVCLKPLDPESVKEYLLNHEIARPEIVTPDNVERIHDWAGGLPSHLDKVLERIPYFTLTQILHDDAEPSSSSTSEPPPESLKAAVAHLQQSLEPREQKALSLLKVLTILKDGETLDSIKRFDREPFRSLHVEVLITHSLLEEVPISQTAADLISGERKLMAGGEPQKFLKVPRQVRDYVNLFLAESEKDEIVKTCLPLLFGRDWWKGKVRFRQTLFRAYGQSGLQGPGNEHIIARRILQRAIDRGNKQQTERYCRVALIYCQRLYAADRFRDTLIASSAIVELLRGTAFIQQFAEACGLYAKCLRMTGHYADSVTIFEEALSCSHESLTDDFRGNLHLGMALGYKSMESKPEAARLAAEKCLSLVEKESGDGYQARSVIAQVTLKGAALHARLSELESGARGRKFSTAANNIAIIIASETKNPSEALQWLNRVLSTSQELYNRVRAIVEKAAIIGDRVSFSSLDAADSNLLQASYSYAYSQRIGDLMERCHTVLWRLFRKEGLFAPLVRLFRFSSFVWRLRDKEERETKYLLELDTIELKQIPAREATSLAREYRYLECRRSAFASRKLSLKNITPSVKPATSPPVPSTDENDGEPLGGPSAHR